MRHGKKINHLGRTASHRSAMLSNMASSLIIHKRINTTVAKAKALRKYVEPILTKSKEDNTHSRRVVFSYLQNKESVNELFDHVADRIANRPGGYTRIIKTGSRLGDNAEMCVMELVDFNELLLTEEKPKKSRRSRRGKSKKAEGETTQVEASEVSTVEEVKEKPTEDTTEEVSEPEAKVEETENKEVEVEEETKEEKADEVEAVEATEVKTEEAAAVEDEAPKEEEKPEEGENPEEKKD